jgi:negative regulator of sigma E activity
MAKILRTEDRNWKGINDAFDTLMDADKSYLEQYDVELARIGAELEEIDKALKDGKMQQAWEKYNNLRNSLLSSKQAFSNEILRMQIAQTHVHKLLT